MTNKEHHVIISLASNHNQEVALAAAREQLTQLLTDVHFTSAIWTEPSSVMALRPWAVDYSERCLRRQNGDWDVRIMKMVSSY